MWKFNYAIPSMMIMATVVGHYISLPRLPIRKNRIFIYYTVVECMVMVLDIVASWADNNYEAFSDITLYVLNGAYFVFFFARGFAICIFTASALKINIIARKELTFLIELPINIGIILVLLSPLTQIFFYIDETGYHAGPLYNSLYFIFSFYLIISYYFIYRERHHFVRQREKSILLTAISILALGLILRYIFPTFLLMNIYCFIAYMTLYLGFENPDIYLVERTFIYNRIALRDYITELTSSTKGIDALVFGAKNYLEKIELYGIQQTNQGQYLIQNYLSKEFPDLLTFNFENGKFVLFTSSPTDWHEIYEKIRERFQQPWTSLDTELYLEIGGCIVEIDNQKLSPQILFKVFNEAFDLAEKTVGDDIAFLNNANIEKIKEQVEIKKSLEYAIEHEEVEVFLQPIVESNTGKLAGAEALARIRNSEGEIIPPGLFIPIAEQNGKINQLSKLVFKTCCETINLPEFKKLNLRFINVNLSPIQFMISDLDDSLKKYIERSGADADFFHLEITEEAMIDEQQMDQQIISLTGQGFKFVLDDYGKGYSNMSRLRKTPFINIKLDMSLVWDYCKNPDDILPNEVKTFRSAGFEITAEGIENEEIANMMREIGCTYLQGYLYSKPLPINEFIEKYS